MFVAYPENFLWLRQLSIQYLYTYHISPRFNAIVWPVRIATDPNCVQDPAAVPLVGKFQETISFEWHWHFLFIPAVGWDWVSSNLNQPKPEVRLPHQRKMIDDSMESIGVLVPGKETLNILRKTYCGITLYATNSTWTTLEVNLVNQGGKQANHRWAVSKPEM